MAVKREIRQKDTERRDCENGLLYTRGDNEKPIRNIYLTVDLATLCAQSGQGHVPRVIDLGHRQLCPTHL